MPELCIFDYIFSSKSHIMKTLLHLTALGLVLALFSGCTLFDKDLKIARNLEGDWDVVSFTADGVETMQVGITSFTMEFKEYDRGNDEGDFKFTIIYSGGGTDILSGEYLVDDDGANLELTYPSGEKEDWDLDLEKDDLEISTISDGGVLLIARAKRD